MCLNPLFGTVPYNPASFLLSLLFFVYSMHFVHHPVHFGPATSLCLCDFHSTIRIQFKWSKYNLSTSLVNRRCCFSCFRCPLAFCPLCSNSLPEYGIGNFLGPATPRSLMTFTITTNNTMRTSRATLTFLPGSILFTIHKFRKSAHYSLGYAKNLPLTRTSFRFASESSPFYRYSFGPENNSNKCHRTC